jgi:hypothetical protein
MADKSAYICGPLTELPEETRQPVKSLYSALAQVCLDVTGVRAFVPHEHFDPIAQANFTPVEVDAAERRQVCESTNLLVVVALEPTWGGGIEVEMANRNGIPVVILKPQKKVSRLLLGNPAVKKIVEFSDIGEAAEALRSALKEN